MTWNLASVWESVADAVGDRVALVHGDQRTTWGEFDDRSARLATALSDAGLGVESKVASYLYNSNEYVEGLFATFKLRAVPVNVNYRYTEDELLYLLDNSDAEAVLFHASLGDRVAAIKDRAPLVKAWIEIDDGGEHQSFADKYEDVIASHEPMPRIERSEDDMYFLYTGGTTGMPKGVMWRAGDLWGVLAGSTYALVGKQAPASLDDVGRVAKELADEGRDIAHLPASPLMHGTGAFSSFQSMFLGGRIVTLTGRHFDAHELWDTVQREGVTQGAIVGDAFAKPMLKALEEAEDKGEPYDLSSLVLLISSGVMFSSEVKKGLMQRGQFICFDSLGSSEGVGFANAITAPGGEQTTAKFTIGPEARVLKEDGVEVVPGSDEVGMLAVGGHIPLGYYKDESKSAATFRVVGGKRWSIPGDFARVEEDGTIVLLGRGSVVINSGGEKIYPEEVEEAVKLNPAVADCLVVGVPDDRFGEVVTAVVSFHPGQSATAEEIGSTLGALSRFKQPKHYVFVPVVQRAPNGKADYKWAKETAKTSV